MRLSAFFCVVFCLGLVGCDAPDKWPEMIDSAVFKVVGGTVFADLSELTIKEVHLDSSALYGKEVVLEGELQEVGKFVTYVVMSDATARMLIVLTHLDGLPEAIQRLKTSKDGQAVRIRVLGTVKNGMKGLPFVLARAVTVVS